MTGFYMLPQVGLSNEKNFKWIFFSSSPPSYTLNAPFLNFSPPSNNLIFYTFDGFSSILNGSSPIGQSFEYLKDINRFTFYVPMHTKITADRYNNRDFQVRGCSLFFTLNGVELSKYRVNCPQGNVKGRIGEFTEHKYDSDFMTIQFTLKKNLYDLLYLDKF